MPDMNKRQRQLNQDSKNGEQQRDAQNPRTLGHKPYRIRIAMATDTSRHKGAFQRCTTGFIRQDSLNYVPNHG